MRITFTLSFFFSSHPRCRKFRFQSEKKQTSRISKWRALERLCRLLPLLNKAAAPAGVFSLCCLVRSFSRDSNIDRSDSSWLGITIGCILGFIVLCGAFIIFRSYRKGREEEKRRAAARARRASLSGPGGARPGGSRRPSVSVPVNANAPVRCLSVVASSDSLAFFCLLFYAGPR